jgi:transaldolase
MTKLRELHDRFGQSPWLHDRGQLGLTGMGMTGWLAQGIRGVTSSDLQAPAERAARWSSLLRPAYEDSAAGDGFVSVGIPPEFGRDRDAMVEAAHEWYRRIGQQNLMVEIPATPEGVAAVRQLIGEGRSVNATLIASLGRYEEVIDAYLAGLESIEGSLSRCHSVASFALSPVDAEVDRRLATIGSDAALSLRGQGALAQAKVAYRMFEERFFGARWQALTRRGAKVQRLVWSWTTVEDPAYPDLWYVENLVGPNTVTALSPSTIAALDDHGTLARTVDRRLDTAEATLRRLARAGVELGDVGRVVERDAMSA